MTGKQNASKQKTVLPILAVLCFVCLAGMCAALFYTASPAAQSEFVPPSFDASAVSGTPDVPEGLGWQELDAQAFRVGVCGAVVVEGSQADVWLTNPESNTVWLKLRILDEDGEILGETGLIRPGEYVQSITFDTVSTSGTAISMKVMAYEPETYHSGGAVTLNTVVQVEDG